MLRVVDDLAAMLRCRDVYLAAESSVSADSWDSRTQEHPGRHDRHIGSSIVWCAYMAISLHELLTLAADMLSAPSSRPFV